MKRKKIILALILAATAGICHAQENRLQLKFQPMNVPMRNIKYTIITHNFTAPELVVNQAFIDSLNGILFDKKKEGLYQILSSPTNTLRNFHLSFEQKDSLNYFIRISLDEYPGNGSKGFFEHNGYLYWFYRDIPPGIILETTKFEKHFSYDECISSFPEIDDPILWFVRYNNKTGELKDNKWPF